MLEKIVIGFIIFLSLATALGLYIIILGANMDKTPEERKLEDEEQMKYLREYRNRKNGGNKNDK